MQGKQLTGPIPFTIFNISTLQAVGFSGNRLSGSLPVALRHCPRHKRPNTIKLISECSELHILSLSFNNFPCHIAKEISNLRKFEQL